MNALRLSVLCLFVLLLCCCVDEHVSAPRGSAQDLAAMAGARADANARAADMAAVDAATKAEAAARLEREAEAIPTAARIAAAADARVAAASAKAVAEALHRVAEESEAKAVRAAELGRKEREADRAADDLRALVARCRFYGLLGVIAGAVLGGVLGYFGGARLGILVGGGTASLGLLVVAYGATVTWLPLVLTGAIVVGIALWILTHQRTLRVGTELSRTLDVVEAKANDDLIAHAKDELGKAVARSGLGSYFARLRGRWRAASSPGEVRA